MNKYIISYPRSGQHLVERFLNFYCSCKQIPYSYCEYYTCCKVIPCKHNKIFQKNHDFKNKIVVDENSKYLVLFRANMLEQLEAFYRYINYVSKKKTTPVIINYSDEEKIKVHLFVKKHIPNYIAFINKWVLNNRKNILKVDYDVLLKNTDEFKKIILFFFNDNNCDDIINQFLSQKPIKKQHYLIDCWNFNDLNNI